jgi:hypothetical protein
VTNNLHISSPTITGEASAGGPYALIGKNANVDIIVSGSAEPVTLGKHKEIITFQPSACSCGKKAPGPIISYPEVAPDSYTYDWTLSPGNFGKSGSGQSFKGTNNVSTPGEYLLTANFKGTSKVCGICAGTASATDKCMVYQLIVTNTTWLGLDRTGVELNKKTGESTATLTPETVPTWSWVHNGVCSLVEPTYWNVVKYKTKDKELCSSYFLDQILTVTAKITNPQTFSITTSTNFTVVKVDVTVEGRSLETEEEFIGAVVPYIEDNSDGSLTSEGIDKLKSVSIQCFPSDLPSEELITISISGNVKLYEKINDEIVPAKTQYAAKEIKDKKFYLHGHSMSGLLRDSEVKAVHETSAAKDIVKVTVDEGLKLNLVAYDTSTKAGVRTNAFQLHMVKDDLISSRTAELRADIRGRLRENSPTWKIGFWDNSEQYPGQTTVPYSGLVSATTDYRVKADGIFGAQAERSAAVVLWENGENKWTIKDDILKKYTTMLNLCLTLIGDSPPTIETGGEIHAKFKRVDYYNDGGKVGDYVALGGEISLKIGQFKSPGVKIPTFNPSINFELFATLQPLTFKAGGDFVYDESKSNPWVASSGYLTAGSSISATIEGVFGYNGQREDNWGLVAKITGEVAINAIGTIVGEGNKIVAKSKIEVGKLNVTGSVNLQAGANAQWQLYKIDYVIFDGKTIPAGGGWDEYELYSW